ncbi:DUF3306 domain-containing protein [Prosthecomicrobium sp. N25]|uniref:DUF3306 domain-containing protein n=1 Tax=Prosthecomicrobium sp. N25 TaxID=3129254 RepID=UPI003077DED4
MTDEPGFLSRWSRLKRKAGAEAAPDLAAPVEPVDAAPASGTPAAAPAGEEEPFDLARLPSLDEITAETDVTDFLRREVPPDLRNAALRRAWAADPVIRDFVGLADYDWDFNAPGGNQVFGPLDPTTDVVRMAARILGGGSEADVEANESLTEPSAAQDESLHREDGALERSVEGTLSENSIEPPLQAGAAASCRAAQSTTSSDKSLARPDKDAIPMLQAFETAVSDARTQETTTRRRRRHGNALPGQEKIA